MWAQIQYGCSLWKKRALFRHRDTTQREDIVKTQGEDSRLQAQEREPQQILHFQPSEGTSPANTLILTPWSWSWHLDCQPPELGDDPFLLFKVLGLWSLIMAALQCPRNSSHPCGGADPEKLTLQGSSKPACTLWVLPEKCGAGWRSASVKAGQQEVTRGVLAGRCCSPGVRSLEEARCSGSGRHQSLSGSLSEPGLNCGKNSGALVLGKLRTR